MGKRVQVRTTITMDEGLRDKFMEYAESLGCRGYVFCFWFFGDNGFGQGK
jgi:hypothetical protein